MEDKEKDLDNLEKLVEKEEKVTAHDMCSAEEEKVNEESEKKLTPEEEIEALWAERLHLTPPPYPERQQPPVAPSVPPQPPVAPADPLQPPVAPSVPPQSFAHRPVPPYPAPEREPMPQTHLVWSVLATVMCCLIPGIVAIVYSTMVSSRYYAGDLEGARRASRMAEYWIIASVVTGVVAAAVYLPLSLLA
jgi:hypothetical protein